MPLQPLTSEDLEAIETLFDLVPRYLLAGDFESWAGLFAEDAVFMPPNSPRIHGRPMIRAYIESYPKIREMSTFDIEIHGHGELAVGRSAFSITVEPEGADKIQDTAKQLVVFRKQGDGKWVVTVVMFNSDLPMG